ncbi:MAG: SPOR domain-containing protein, partial [Deltaproteobacteria bacterium]|nr:SPOR domain-containing protein [Deltaproteobacteria bacterium]
PQKVAIVKQAPDAHATVKRPPEDEVHLTAAPASLGAYTVQIGASQEKKEAQRLESKARSAGLKPYSVEANLGAKGTWFRVRVGSFANKDVATRYQKDVERELRVSAMVMPTK